MPQLQETESFSPKLNQTSLLTNSNDRISLINKREISSIKDKLSSFNKQSEIIDFVGFGEKFQNLNSNTSSSSCSNSNPAKNLKELTGRSSSKSCIPLRTKPPLPTNTTNNKSTLLADFSSKLKQKAGNPPPLSSSSTSLANPTTNKSGHTPKYSLSNTQSLIFNFQPSSKNNDSSPVMNLHPYSTKTQSMNSQTRTSTPIATMTKTNAYQEHLSEIHYQNFFSANKSPVNTNHPKASEAPNNLGKTYSVIDQLIKDTNAIILNKAKTTTTNSSTGLGNKKI